MTQQRGADGDANLLAAVLRSLHRTTHQVSPHWGWVDTQYTRRSLIALTPASFGCVAWLVYRAECTC